jgi:hypothetical protein
VTTEASGNALEIGAQACVGVAGIMRPNVSRRRLRKPTRRSLSRVTFNMSPIYHERPATVPSSISPRLKVNSVPPQQAYSARDSG